MTLTLLIIALWFIAFVWLVIVFITLRGLSHQRPLLASSNLRLTAGDTPLVSILVPARNEQHRVLEAPRRTFQPSRSEA